MRSTGLLLIALVSLSLPALAQEGDLERVYMVPSEKAGWSPKNIVAGLSTIVTGPGYWYGEKEVLVETVPADCQLALYFIRANFQKMYEQALAPIILVTPRRIHSTSKDVVAIRAAYPGFASKEVKFKVFDVPEKVTIQLDPLPNSLVFLGHTHIAGRSTITLRTTEEPDLSISRPRGGSGGFTLALSETADKVEEAAEGGSGLVERITVDQLGEDLVVRVKTKDPDPEVRAKSSYDPIRKEHVYVLDVMRKGTRPPNSSQVRSEIESVSYARGNACDEAFARVLRARIDQQTFARAFRPSGGISEFYQTEAMMRLGRFNSGKVKTLSGEAFRTGSPIELALAIQSAPSVRDYLGLLGALARTRPEPAEFLRALLAPDMPADDFAPIYRKAEAARRSCS